MYRPSSGGVAPFNLTPRPARWLHAAHARHPRTRFRPRLRFMMTPPSTYEGDCIADAPLERPIDSGVRCVAARQRATSAVTRVGNCTERLANRLTLRQEGDFAEGPGLQDFFVGAGGLGERKLLANHRAQRAVLQTGDDTRVDLFL